MAPSAPLLTANPTDLPYQILQWLSHILQTIVDFISDIWSAIWNSLGSDWHWVFSGLSKAGDSILHILARAAEFCLALLLNLSFYALIVGVWIMILAMIPIARNNSPNIGEEEDRARVDRAR